jgi:hypothetical protein
MATFLIESQHQARMCHWVLRPGIRQGTDGLVEYQWGCRDGIHSGWRIVQADSKFDVQATIPPVLRSQTRIVQLNRFTPDQLMAFHQGELSARAVPAGIR